MSEEVKETVQEVAEQPVEKAVEAPAPKAQKEERASAVRAVFEKDYKYEGLILLALAVIAIVLGVMILTGDLTVSSSAPLIGDYPTAFAWILTILGAASLLLAVYPYYKPSFYEIRRVTWPTRGEMGKDTIIVFGYILIIALVFLLMDFLLVYVVKGIDAIPQFL